MRRILIIRGNHFMGYQLEWRLLAAGERVTTLNRGRRGDLLQTGSSAFADVLRGRDFDAVVDFAAFDAADAPPNRSSSVGKSGGALCRSTMSRENFAPEHSTTAGAGKCPRKCGKTR